MYLGRIVAIGMTNSGKTVAMYRVSSRSFPNRRAVQINNRVSIIPREGCESDLAKNPYISYNCIRLAGEWAVATNGSQTDPIVEKIAQGMSPRDAIALGLLAMDYEKDSLDTPRIVAVVSNKRPVGFLGIIRKDAVLVREFQLKPGEAYYLSTYECNQPNEEQRDGKFTAETASEAAQYIVDGGVFASFTNAVTSAVAIATCDGFELAEQIVE